MRLFKYTQAEACGYPLFIQFVEKGHLSEK